ncbi:hypothetical protein F2Q69_00007080 [Brassica cretica]|uniref:Uncharacterized protein n=1 Tax=Brassica cretica TaxID=69181 RepID=A0A8S9NUZ4_BRACR|nr:hypothetical protein F2Q69_00007080 [Brassica cretica]
MSSTHSANDRAESVLGLARRTAELNPSRVQLGHSPNWTGPAQRTAKLNPSRVQLGRFPNWTSPARRMAELNPSQVQLDHSPNWTGPARGTAELNPSRVQLGRSPNWTGPARRTTEILSSKRKSSTKSRRNCSAPEGSSSQHVGAVPKVEFSAKSINPEEVDAWWMAMGEVKPPTPVVWVPPSFKPTPCLRLSPSALKPSYLKNGDIPIFPIFVIIFGNFTFIRGNFTFILPYKPSINRHKAYGFSVKKFDRAVYVLGRYVVTELHPSSVATNRAWLELSRYVATELCSCSVATWRPSRVRSRSLRSDQAWLELGRYIATELGLCVV